MAGLTLDKEIVLPTSNLTASVALRSLREDVSILSRYSPWSMPRKEVARILRRVELLRYDPRPPGSEKLSGQER